MKKYVTKLMLIFVICVAIVSCDSGIMNYIPMPAELIPERAEFVPPTFLPIDNTEDIVVVANWRNQVDASELIAIDTKNNKVVQVCRIETTKINRFHIDSYSRFTNSGFCYFTIGTRDIYCWDIKTGKTEKINIEPTEIMGLYEDNCVYTGQDEGNNYYSSSKSYCYNPHTKTNKLIAKSFPSSIGKDCGIVSDLYTNNDNIYCVVFSNYSLDTFSFNVVNLTTQKKIDLHCESNPNKMYRPLKIRDNKYIFSESKSGVLMSEIVSFEPENIITICDIPGWIPEDIKEDENYIYTACSFGEHICKISKSTKNIVAQTENMPECDGSAVIKNGYAWLGAGLDSGDFYRIELADNDGDGVLKWELFKNK